MTLRSILSACSPWRYEWRTMSSGWGRERVRVLAPWVRRWAVYLAVLLGALAGLLLASRADAAETWSRTIQWRSSVEFAQEIAAVRGKVQL